MDASVLIRRGNKIQRQSVEQRLKERGHPETAIPGDSSYMRTPNANTAVDAEKCLLTRT